METEKINSNMTEAAARAYAEAIFKKQKRPMLETWVRLSALG